MSDYATPLVGVAAFAEEYEARPTLLHRYERRRTPVTWPELPVPMAALVSGDTGGVVVDEIRAEDEVTKRTCSLCWGHEHVGLCEGRKL